MAIACSDPVPRVVVRFDPDAYAAGDWWALPWPSEAKRTAKGTVDALSWPGVRDNYLLRNGLPLFQDDFHGFSPNGLIVFAFTGPLDASSLPATAATLAATAAVQLVNIEAGSARYLERIPVELRYEPRRASMHPDNALKLLPVPGFPMAPGQTYAALILDGVRGADGPLAQAPELRRLLADPEARPELRFAPLVAALSDLGIAAERIVAATVFTTRDPVAVLAAARDVVRARPRPTWRNFAADPHWTRCATFETTTFTLAQAELDVPLFLREPRPYFEPGSGVLVTDATSGMPQVQATETIRVTLSLPSGPVPAGGWPTSIYMHGAGGDRHSFIRDNTACSLAVRGIAGVAIDLPLHGERNPTDLDPVYLLVNPLNLAAVIGVELQAAIDLFTLTYALTGGLTVPAGSAGNPTAITLATDPLGFIGHSQGTFVGVPYAAFESDVDALVLSGSGGHFITFLTDRIAGQSIDAEIFFGIEDGAALGDALAVLLDVPGERLDRFHPLATMVQMALEPIDTINYAPYVTFLGDDPRSGGPKHVYQSAGLLDPFDPPGVNQALAVAMGLDIAAPLAMPFPHVLLRGGAVVEPPLQGNRSVGGIIYTAANSQFPQGDHWVYLTDGIARAQGTDFLADALRGQVPTVRPRCTWTGSGTLDC